MASGAAWARRFWARRVDYRAFALDCSRYLVGIALWMPPAIWFWCNVAEVTKVHGLSMYPFLNSKDSLSRSWVLNYKWRDQDLRRGMVVSLRWASVNLVVVEESPTADTS